MKSQTVAVFRMGPFGRSLFVYMTALFAILFVLTQLRELKDGISDPLPKLCIALAVFSLVLAIRNLTDSLTITDDWIIKRQFGIERRMKVSEIRGWKSVIVNNSGGYVIESNDGAKIFMSQFVDKPRELEACLRRIKPNHRLPAK